MYAGSGSSYKRKFVVATVGSGEFLWDVDYLCGSGLGSSAPPYITGGPVELSMGAVALSECKLLAVSHSDLLRVLWTDTINRMRKAAQVKMSWRQARLNRRQRAREAKEEALRDEKVGLKTLPRSANVDTSQLSTTIMVNISGMRYVIISWVVLSSCILGDLVTPRDLPLPPPSTAPPPALTDAPTLIPSTHFAPHAPLHPAGKRRTYPETQTSTSSRLGHPGRQRRRALLLPRQPPFSSLQRGRRGRGTS